MLISVFHVYLLYNYFSWLCRWHSQLPHSLHTSLISNNLLLRYQISSDWIYLVVFLPFQGACWATSWAKCEGFSYLGGISLYCGACCKPAEHTPWPCLCKSIEVLLQRWVDPGALWPSQSRELFIFVIILVIVINISDSGMINQWWPFLRWICWVWRDPAHGRVGWQGPGNQHAEREVWFWESGDDRRWCHRPWGLPSSCKYNQLSCIMKHQLLFSYMTVISQRH